MERGAFSVQGGAMRERIFIDTGAIGTEHIYYYEKADLSVVVLDQTQTWQKNRQYAAMQDVVVPNFKARQAKGEIFVNALNSQAFQSLHQPCFAHSKGYWGYNGYCESVLQWMYPSISGEPMTWLQFQEFLDDFQGERDVATTKAWSNVDVSEMQALASLGEMPETLKWIGSLYIRMAHLIRMFSKKQLRRQLVKQLKRLSNKQKLTAATDNVSNFWLEFRYAVRPLVFEMTQAVAALKAALDTAQRFTARGYNLVEEDSKNTVTWDVSPYLSMPVELQYARKSNYRAGVLYRLEAEINKLASVWGLNQGFETFWELTPFSFIIDWFFTIGDVISSWNVTSGILTLGSWITEQHVITKKWLYGASGVNAYHGMFSVSGWDPIHPGETTVQWVLKRRIPNPDRSILPHCRIRLDAAKLLDLATIGRGLYNGLLTSSAKRS